MEYFYIYLLVLLAAAKSCYYKITSSCCWWLSSIYQLFANIISLLLILKTENLLVNCKTVTISRFILQKFSNTFVYGMPKLLHLFLPNVKWQMYISLFLPITYHNITCAQHNPIHNIQNRVQNKSYHYASCSTLRMNAKSLKLNILVPTCSTSPHASLNPGQ